MRRTTTTIRLLALAALPPLCGGCSYSVSRSIRSSGSGGSVVPVTKLAEDRFDAGKASFSSVDISSHSVNGQTTDTVKLTLPAHSRVLTAQKISGLKAGDDWVSIKKTLGGEFPKTKTAGDFNGKLTLRQDQGEAVLQFDHGKLTGKESKGLP